MERFERHDERVRGHKVDDPNDHRAMSKCRILNIGVKHGGGGLVQDGCRGLINPRGLTVAAVREGRHIAHFRTTGLVAGEVIARKQHISERWVVRVDTRVDVCDNSSAGYVKSFLGVRDSHDSSSRLVGIAGPDRGAIVIRSEEHTSELQSQSNLVCRLLLEKKKLLLRAGLLRRKVEHYDPGATAR